MKKILLSLATFFVVSPLSHAADAANKRKALIIVSLDGVGYQQLQTMDPSFLNNKGVQKIQPPNPSLTLESHATIATGVNPEEHGIVRGGAMRLFRRGSELKVEPMWATLSKEGFYVSAHSWPMSDRPYKNHEHNTDGKNTPYDPRAPLKTLADTSKEAIEQLNQWKHDRNFFMMAYTGGLDAEGHKYGPQSPEVKAKWESIKKQLEGFKRELAKVDLKGDELTVLYVSDHGMADKETVAKVKSSLVRDGDDSGAHGLDPEKFPEMNGVIWVEGPRHSALPDKLTGIKPWVMQHFGITDAAKASESKKAH